ncbi:MAG: hypothetical protein C6W56_11475 [Caldibacillus debilis]|nr:MAG: hypothetical protein C6W56_11475 [Caldibacillus debilis]
MKQMLLIVLLLLSACAGKSPEPESERNNRMEIDPIQMENQPAKPAHTFHEAEYCRGRRAGGGGLPKKGGNRDGCGSYPYWKMATPKKGSEAAYRRRKILEGIIQKGRTSPASLFPAAIPPSFGPAPPPGFPTGPGPEGPASRQDPAFPLRFGCSKAKPKLPLFGKGTNPDRPVRNLKNIIRRPRGCPAFSTVGPPS